MHTAHSLENNLNPIKKIFSERTRVLNKKKLQRSTLKVLACFTVSDFFQSVQEGFTLQQCAEALNKAIKEDTALQIHSPKISANHLAGCMMKGIIHAYPENIAAFYPFLKSLRMHQFSMDLDWDDRILNCSLHPPTTSENNHILNSVLSVEEKSHKPLDKLETLLSLIFRNDLSDVEKQYDNLPNSLMKNLKTICGFCDGGSDYMFRKILAENFPPVNPSQSQFPLLTHLLSQPSSLLRLQDPASEDKDNRTTPKTTRHVKNKLSNGKSNAGAASNGLVAETAGTTSNHSIMPPPPAHLKLPKGVPTFSLTAHHVQLEQMGLTVMTSDKGADKSPATPGLRK